MRLDDRDRLAAPASRIVRNARPTVGVVAGGLGAYWPQFPNLLPELQRSARTVVERLGDFDAKVVDAGFVSDATDAERAAEILRAGECDLIVMFLTTYMTATMVVPIARLAGAPVLLINLQPGPSMDHATFGTGEWLAYCGCCTLPEVANTFERCGIPFRSVSGHLLDERAWTRIEAWVRAAGVQRALRHGRHGLMGHLYPGMYDVSTDLTLVPAMLGGHVEVLEFDDLRVRVDAVTPKEIEAKLEEVRATFVLDDSVDPDDLSWAAQVAVGLERVVDEFALDSLAYYHRGLDGELHERLGAGMILGASLLTAAHVPTCGEFELRTSIAMLILDRLGAGGSFTEMQALNFTDGVVEMGHDGPAHLGISERSPMLRGLGVFHGKRGWGVSVEFDVAHGPVTAFGITQLRNGQLRFVLSEGEVVAGPLLQIGNTTSRVDFGCDPGAWCDAWAATASAHHWALGTGHRAQELRAVADLLGIEVVEVALAGDTPRTRAGGVSVRVAAVDLGASSGRVFAACIGEDEFTIEEVARFPNGAITVLGTLYWDILALYRGMLEGIRATGRSGPLDGVGIDSWAVDFGLIDASGALLGNPVHHRDKRSAAGVEIAHRSFSAADLYGRTGIAHQRFNTVFQLAAIARSPQAAIAERLLLIPDLLTYWLTGEMGMEVTNASTTGLLSAHALEWEIGLLTGLSISPSLFPPLRAPGERAGMIHPEVLGELGISAAVPVIAVASHDTGSAVVGVPATTDRFAYISCGTWSLVGVELDHVVVTDASRAANFTNERGLDGTNRFLRNVMGLWLLQEAVRTWERAGGPVELPALLARSASVPAFRSVFDPDDERFLEPGDMPRRIAEVCVERGEPVPVTPEEVTRAILDSLALAYARAVHEAEDLAGTVVETVHLVGGGTQNALLCQLTADAVGVPVVAGPVEAAAIGNAIVQARALGAIGGDLPALRAGFARHVHVARYEPSPEVRSQASAAAQRFGR